MHLPRFSFLGLILMGLLPILPLDAQNVQVDSTKKYWVMGEVVDSLTNKPIAAVSVELLNVGTGKWSDGALLDSTATFKLSSVETGIYQVVVSAPGYILLKSESFKLNDSNYLLKLAPIKLSSVIKNLDGANIVIDGPLIENKIDKLVYNAERDISSKGGNAADILRKVPMVEVDGDGNVTMRGSQNIRVLINGKPSGMMAANVKDAIKMIPADNIAKVEVITSPSAKYDAEGTAGIINIITKQKKMKGTSGNIFSGGGNRSGNLGINVNHQNGKTGIGFSLGGYFWRNRGTTSALRTNTESGYLNTQEQTSNQRNWGFGPWGMLSIDHDINKNQSVSFSARMHGGGFFSGQEIDTRFGSNNQPPALLFTRNNDIRNVTLGYDMNADYRKTFNKPDKELGFSVQYTLSNQNNQYETDQFNAVGINNYREQSKNIGNNKELTLQLDYTNPLNKKMVFETGVKSIIRKVTSDYRFDSFSFANNQFQDILDRNNNFYYNQWVYGGYGQIGIKWSEKYSTKIGTRLEYTEFGGGYIGSNEKFKGKPYLNPIPFINITRNFGFSGYARINYTKRIQRPSMFFLNPYTSLSDPRNTTTGNPYLEAEVADLLELSVGQYSKKGGVNLTLYHRRTQNAIETIRQVDTAGVYSTTYGNIGKNATTGMDINLNLRGSKWMINFNGSAGYVFIQSTAETGVTSGLSNGAITYSAGLWGNYKFGKENKYSVEAFGRFNAPQISLQGFSTTWYFYTIGVKKRFKNDKGGIGLGLDNPFTLYNRFKTINEGKDFQLESRTKNFVWGIRFNFDYSFGKMEFQQPQRKKKGIKNDDLKEGSGDGNGGGGR